MKMKPGSLLSIVTALSVAGAATAATLPKEGTYDYTACWSGTSSDISFSKTHSANSYEMTGTIVSKVPGGMFDNNTFRCVGMGSLFAGKNGGGNVCETIDTDGDKRLAVFAISSEGKVTRELITGTGKYEGMTTTSSVTLLGPFPAIKAGTFQQCNHQSGTYKMK